jgi:hypothetical protein
MHTTLIGATVLLSCAAAHAADVKVMIAGDFQSAYRSVVPRFERATANSVSTGDPADLIVTTAGEMDELVRQGKVVRASRIDLARLSKEPKTKGEPRIVTVFSAGLRAGAKEPKEATALLGFLSAPSAAPAIRRAGLEPLSRKPDLADLSEGSYFGDVISDSKGSSQSDVTLNVVRIDRNLVRITSDYARLPMTEVPLTRAMDQILAARGNTVFLLDPKKSPAQLGVSFDNEVSWAGAKR